MNVEERFQKYLEEKNIPDQRAEKECGLSAGMVKNSRRGSHFGSDKLVKILTTYTDLSAEWLLRGTGSMLKSEGKAIELENKIMAMCDGRPNKDAAYDIILSMVDMVTKTYNFFGKEG